MIIPSPLASFDVYHYTKHFLEINIIKDYAYMRITHESWNFIKFYVQLEWIKLQCNCKEKSTFACRSSWSEYTV